MIDTHCHLYAEELSDDIDEVLSRAQKVGVEEIWLPNIDEHSLDKLLAVSDRHPKKFRPMLGLHPCYVKKEGFTEQLELIYAYIQKVKPIAIGEIGLDLYWDKSTLAPQKEALQRQYEWAKDLKLPVILHSREAFDETLQVALQFPTVPGIFHCFTGSTDEAKKAIDAGYLLGIGGVLTYKNSSLREVLKQIDIKYLVLETDAPYLSPVPFRGKRNEPSYLHYIATQLAEVKGLSLEEVAHLTSKNAYQLISGNGV